MATSKRKGQHTVKAVIRVYSAEALAALSDRLNKPSESLTEFVVLNAEHFDLVELTWRPRPSKNEWNTESDWRRMISTTFAGLYYDVLIFEPSWTAVD